MNDLEGRLKEAYVAATDTVSPDNLRRLDEQFVLITWPEPRRQRPVRRWLIPLTSVAVLAIIAATALPAFLTSSGGGRATSAQGERFVGALTPDSRQFVIVNAATGMKVASVTPPTQHEIFSNAATGDGVTYVTAVTRPGVCGARLYKFSLDSAGKPGRLTPFDGGHLLQDVSQLALSADGHSFADLVYVCPAAKKANASLYFVNFKTGQKRRWTIYSFSTISELSLSRDGGLLVLGGGPINGLRSGIVLVNTSGRSGPINARSADLVTSDEFGHHHGFSVALPTITPNGRTVFFVTIGPGQMNASEQIRAVDVSTRKVRLVARATGLTDLATDPSVRRAIGIHQAGLPKPKTFMINLGTGQITYLKPSFFTPSGGRYIW